MRAVVVPITSVPLAARIHGMRGGNFDLMWHDLAFHYYRAHRCTDTVRSFRLQTAEFIRVFFGLDDHVMTRFIWWELIDFEYYTSHMNPINYLKKLSYSIEASGPDLFETLLAFSHGLFQFREKFGRYRASLSCGSTFIKLPEDAALSDYIREVLQLYSRLKGLELDVGRLMDFYRKYGFQAVKDDGTRCLKVFVQISEDPEDLVPIESVKLKSEVSATVSAVGEASFFSVVSKALAGSVDSVVSRCSVM